MRPKKVEFKDTLDPELVDERRPLVEWLITKGDGWRRVSEGYQAEIETDRPSDYISVIWLVDESGETATVIALREYERSLEQIEVPPDNDEDF